jgi:PPM family protein phosphatase
VVDDDGLLKYIDGQSDMQACAEGLGQLALDSGSRDNVSCITLEVGDN